MRRFLNFPSVDVFQAGFIMTTLFSYSFDIHFLFNAIGVFGSLTYILGFGMVQTRVVCGNGILYCTMQITAATCVLISLNASFNLASFLIQISFASIGLFGLMTKLRDRRLKQSHLQTVRPTKQDEVIAKPKSRSMVA